MRSIDLLVYKPEENSLEPRAKDYNAGWMTAVEILDDDTYLGAEASYNLFTLRKNSDAASDEDRGRLEVSGGAKRVLKSFCHVCPRAHCSGSSSNFLSR